MTDDIKAKLYDFCVTAIEEKLSVINSVLDNAQDSANHETKSTAGDKHDTARAMAHLESEKNAKQLSEINKLKKVLPYLKSHNNKGIAELGSLIKPTTGNYYLSLSLGRANIDSASFFLISAVTPIGKLLTGKKMGDIIKFNGKTIKIKEIL